MSKKLVRIGFVLSLIVVVAQLGFALAGVGALNQRALSGNADWSIQNTSSLQASIGKAQEQPLSVHPAGEPAGAPASRSQEPTKPWLGWVFIAFFIASLLAVGSALGFTPKKVDTRAPSR